MLDGISNQMIHFSLGEFPQTQTQICLILYLTPSHSL